MPGGSERGSQELAASSTPRCASREVLVISVDGETVALRMRRKRDQTGDSPAFTTNPG